MTQIKEERIPNYKLLVYGVTEMLALGQPKGMDPPPPDLVAQSISLGLEILNRRPDVTIEMLLEGFRSIAPITEGMAKMLDEIAESLHQKGDS